MKEWIINNMCQFRSIIVTEKDILSTPYNDHHENIIDKYNLIDDQLPPTFARVEVTPINDIFSTNPDDWKVKVDQEITPNWWVPEYHEELCKEYVINDLKEFRQTKIWKGNLNIYGCTRLTSLSENLTVEGDLYLRCCTNLTSLPKNLKVGGNLDLEGCINLTTLPENLTVEGYLDLRYCTNITILPENLNVGGKIYNQ
jgi:hypothetical protein